MDIMSLVDLVSTLTPDHLPKPAARSPDPTSLRVQNIPRVIACVAWSQKKARPSQLISTRKEALPATRAEYINTLPEKDR